MVQGTSEDKIIKILSFFCNKENRIDTCFIIGLNLPSKSNKVELMNKSCF